MGKKSLSKEKKKVRTNIRIENELKQKAIDNNINFSQVMEDALKLILQQIDEELDK